jgi:hypothetical protein
LVGEYGMTLLQALHQGIIKEWPPHRPLQVIQINSGFVLGTFDNEGGVCPETFVFKEKADAEAFLAVARPELRFIPSALPFF